MSSQIQHCCYTGLMPKKSFALQLSYHIILSFSIHYIVFHMVLFSRKNIRKARECIRLYSEASGSSGYSVSFFNTFLSHAINGTMLLLLVLPWHQAKFPSSVLSFTPGAFPETTPVSCLISGSFPIQAIVCVIKQEKEKSIPFP